MGRIFISHASDDHKFVDTFTELLQTGFQIPYTDIYCTSKGDISGGSQYIDNMKYNLINSEVVVMLLTPKYFQRPFCLAEMGAAWALDKVLAPFIVPPKRIKDIEQPSTPLKATQIYSIEKQEDYTRFFQQLVNLGIVPRYDLNRFNAKLTEYMRRKPWRGFTSSLNSTLPQLGGQLTPPSGQLPNLRPPQPTNNADVLSQVLKNFPNNK